MFFTDIDKTCYDGESMFCLQALEENFCTKNIKYCGKTCGYCKPNEDLGLFNLEVIKSTSKKYTVF